MDLSRFRGEADLSGKSNTRGFPLVNLVLSGFAAYRMQFFCYLKACGRDELNTLNLWMAADGSMNLKFPASSAQLRDQDNFSGGTRL
jgi:hypothetical protein